MGSRSWLTSLAEELFGKAQGVFTLLIKDMARTLTLKGTTHGESFGFFLFFEERGTLTVTLERGLCLRPCLRPTCFGHVRQQGIRASLCCDPIGQAGREPVLLRSHWTGDGAAESQPALPQSYWTGAGPVTRRPGLDRGPREPRGKPADEFAKRVEGWA